MKWTPLKHDSADHTSPADTTHNEFHGGARDHATVILAGHIDKVLNLELILEDRPYSTRRAWSPPTAPAAPACYNHVRPLSQLREEVGRSRERSTFAVVEGDRPRLGSSTVCRVVLRHFCDSDEERFPGGYYTVDLRSQDRTFAVSSVLRRLGLANAEIPTDPQAREQRLREELGSHGALAILVDNVSCSEDVLPFLSEAPGSVTLASTNRVENEVDEREAWVGGRLGPLQEIPVWVGPMTTEERIGVLALHAGVSDLDQAHGDMAKAIVEAVGSDLLAVRAAGNRIRYRLARGENGLRTEYEAIDSTSPQTDVDGLEGLTAELKVHIAELACHPYVDFGVGLSAALQNCAPDEARLFLEDLVDRGLLVEISEDQAEPRYRFVEPRQAEHIRTSQELSLDTDTVRRRILCYYRDLARSVHAALAPHRWLFGQPQRLGPRMTEEEARALARAERDTVRAVILDATNHGEYLLAFEICEAFWPYWFHEGCFSEVVDTHTVLIDVVRPGGALDPARTSRLQAQRSIAYRRDHEFPLARADAEAALELARAAAPLHELTLLTALEAHGDCYRQHTATGEETREDLQAAEECFAESLRVAERLFPEDIRAVANAMRKLAEVRARLGSLTEARFLLERVEHIWRTRLPGDVHNLARTLTGRGDLEARVGGRDEAMGLWSEALELHERTGDGRRIAGLRVRRADVFESLDRAACLEELREASRLYEATGAWQQAALVGDMLRALEAQG